MRELMYIRPFMQTPVLASGALVPRDVTTVYPFQTEGTSSPGLLQIEEMESGVAIAVYNAETHSGYMTQAPLFDAAGQLESLIDMISADCDDLLRLNVYAYSVPSDPADEDDVDIEAIAEARQSVIELLQEHFDPSELEMTWFEEPLSLSLRLYTSDGKLEVETGPL